VLAAAALAIDYTMTLCVHRARSEHAYMDRTGHMQGSVTILQGAVIGLHEVSGAWGATANYSLYLEIGTSRPWSAAPKAEERAVMGRGDMWAIPEPQPGGRHTPTVWTPQGKIPGTGPLMEPRMSLRPAATAEYPLLAERVGMAYRGETLV
jgi:hypothetical protein